MYSGRNFFHRYSTSLTAYGPDSLDLQVPCTVLTNSLFFFLKAKWYGILHVNEREMRGLNALPGLRVPLHVVGEPGLPQVLKRDLDLQIEMFLLLLQWRV